EGEEAFEVRDGRRAGAAAEATGRLPRPRGPRRVSFRRYIRRGAARYRTAQCRRASSGLPMTNAHRHPADGQLPGVSTDGLPAWLRPVADASREATVGRFSGVPTPEQGGRPSAVLVLFGADSAGRAQLLLTERASG